ncbi:Gfo/Idh/MocA family oxidoreductase [Nibrella saemangeumensis]|uniref:Gfo/Idh/MocA family oxidoreductase n=1 Tax=Nibrella saemangeumensis TaxID=1084526 RepID=A0ABP8MCU9_9BACT
MKNLRFAVLGTGFWSTYQIAGWRELDGIELVALYNRTRTRAEQVAGQFNIDHVYDDADELLRNHADEVDFVDIITDVDTHALFTEKAAAAGLNVICQKPMGPNLQTAQRMVDTCRQAGVQFYVHENFRWQSSIRKLKSIIDSGVIGDVFKAQISFCSGFAVFDNQPFLAELEQFILTDIGSHILDVCRFLFGEVNTLYCQTTRVNSRIKGEDVANVAMTMQNGIICQAEMSYASILEKEAFPQTLALVEGSQGSVRLTHDFVLNVTTRSGTDTQTASPVMYPWLDPAYAVVHASIVDCNRNILSALQGQGTAETTGSDNLETIRLVYAAYESARTNSLITVTSFGR